MAEEYKVILTPADKIVLESYKILVEGLAEYLGSGCEIVLHSLDDLERSVIKIVNGHHTGRKEGAPITDLALAMLTRIETESKNGVVCYHTKNRKGEPMKASTIIIQGENDRIIGLLCINYYLNTSIYDILSILSPSPISVTPPVAETFVENVDQLISNAVQITTSQINADSSILPSLKKRQIVAELYNKGIFKMKNAVNMVAEYMEISKNTVYLHLRHVQGEN